MRLHPTSHEADFVKLFPASAAGQSNIKAIIMPLSQGMLIAYKQYDILWSMQQNRRILCRNFRFIGEYYPFFVNYVFNLTLLI